MDRCNICKKGISGSAPSYHLAPQFPDSIICAECRDRIRRIGAYAKAGDPRIEQEVRIFGDLTERADLPEDEFAYIGSLLRRSVNLYNENAAGGANTAGTGAAPTSRSFAGASAGRDGRNPSPFSETRPRKKLSAKKTIVIRRWVALLLVFVSMMGMFLPWAKVAGAGMASNMIGAAFVLGEFGEDLFEYMIGGKESEIIWDVVRLYGYERGIVIDQEEIKKDFTSLQKVFKDGGYSPVELKTLCFIITKYIGVADSKDVAGIKAIGYTIKYFLISIFVLFVLTMISIIFNRKRGLLVANAIVSLVHGTAWIVLVVVLNGKASAYSGSNALAVGVGIFVTVLLAIAAAILYQQDQSKPVIKIVDVFGWMKRAGSFIWNGVRVGAESVRTFFLRKEYLRDDWNCGFCGTENYSRDAFCSRCGAKRPELPRCRSCGKALAADNGAYCPKCGKPAGMQYTCAHCGSYLAPGASFCTHCGNATGNR